MSYQSPYRKFIIHGYSWDKKQRKLTFTYSFDRSLFFQEDVTFLTSFEENNYDRDIFKKACELSLILSGISYYKAYPTREVELDDITLSKEQAEFFNSYYKYGLGEFLYENDLNPSLVAEFPFENTNDKLAARTGYGQGRILMIGGGKDSLVSADLLKKNEMEFTQLRVNPINWVRKQMDTLGPDQILLKRVISKNLIRLNEKDALNGHVPITGILSSLALIVAIVSGKRDVILSNESSANIPNVSYKGMEVNHQYSKSLEFERNFQNYVKNFVAYVLRLFSLLRSFSELSITEHFAKELWDDYNQLFSSSNSNFRLGKNDEIDWKKTSPKTASVFGMLSAFLKPKELLKVFNEDLYKNEELKPTWRRLLGQEDFKPFECVATVNEMKQAVKLASRNGWKGVDEKFNIGEQEFDYKNIEENNLPKEYQRVMVKLNH